MEKTINTWPDNELNLVNALRKNKGNYNEATFFHYYLDFSHWDRNKGIVIKTIREINDNFVEKFMKEIEPKYKKNIYSNQELS